MCGAFLNTLSARSMLSQQLFKPRRTRYMCALSMGDNDRVYLDMYRFVLEAMQYDPTFCELKRLDVDLPANAPRREVLAAYNCLHLYVNLTDPAMLRADWSLHLNGLPHPHLIWLELEQYIQRVSGVLSEICITMDQTGGNKDAPWWHEARTRWAAYAQRMQGVFSSPRDARASTLMGAPRERMKRRMYNLFATHPWCFWMQFWEWSVRVRPMQPLQADLRWNMKTMLYAHKPHLRQRRHTRLVVDEILAEVIPQYELYGPMAAETARAVLQERMDLMRDAIIIADSPPLPLQFVLDEYTRRLFERLHIALWLPALSIMEEAQPPVAPPRRAYVM
jgi:hypothetical protein